MQGFLRIVRRYPLPALAAIGLTAGVLARFVLHRNEVSDAIFLATLIVGGAPVLFGTVRGMLHGKFAADIVAALAITGAALTGEYAAGCVIVLMQTGGEALESFAVHRASASLEALLAHAPRIAHRRTNGELADVPVDEVQIGDMILVRAGEIVPVDGVVAAGTAAVDESALTGEPVPRTAGPGSDVMSGSVALDGALDVRVARPSGESHYQQIVKLMRAAQEDKAPIGRLADRYAVVFTPFTLAMCAAAYAITGSSVAVVAVLVVATPCPLILATPVAIISGINRCARHGIVVKGGGAIELVGHAATVVFDKTGTLTQGTPVVDRVLSLNGWSNAEILRLAAGLEQYSAHPMAQAVVRAGLEHVSSLPPAGDVVEASGQGVSGRVEGHDVDVGSFAHAAQQKLATPEALAAARQAASSEDDAVSVVGIDGEAAGIVVFADPIRPGVPSLMRRLSALGVSETAMLTGDDPATAHTIAAAAGITTVKAQLLPTEKVDAVRDITRSGRTVVMVGDGINDAPALATATVGIALGARGAAVAAEAADIVLTTDDVERAGDVIQIGRDTLRIARQSIWVGLGVSGAMMVVAAFGYIPPAIGALLQEALDVGVILNALRAR
jgi:heavy metal translocating P-type ATPase